MLLSLVVALLAGPAAAAPPPTWSLAGGAQVALDPPGSRPRAPFDALLQDMDGDGDLDLLVNRHLFGLLLYAWEGGRLELVSGLERDEAGLDQPPGVRSVHGAAWQADQVGEPAILAWQPRLVDGSVDLRLQRVGGPGPRWLEVRSHVALEVIEAPTRVVRVDPLTLRLRVPRKDTVQVRLRADSHTPWVALQQLDRAGRTAASPLPFYFGGDLDRFEGPTLAWWAPDPHGLAWGQVGGSREPELVVVRGGDVGTLQEEGIHKDHRFYQWVGEPGGRYALVEAAVPADSGRGRAAEWVDIDGDGLPELSISNRDGPNALMVWRPSESGALVSGAFEDRGPVTGLSGACSEILAWIDLDADGWDDLVALCGAGFEVYQNLGVGAYLQVPASQVGLPEEGLPDLRRGWLRGEHLHVADLDGDGHLDLLGLSLGEGEELRAWCGRAEGGFEACDERLGLSAVRGVTGARQADLDLDGWLDLVVEGPAPAVLMGGPAGFSHAPLASLVQGEAELAGAVLVPLPQGPGRPDLLVLAGDGWRLATATDPGSARRLVVGFDTGAAAWPASAVLRATWADGHRQAIRVGSVGRTHLGQALAPIHLAVPDGQASPALEIRWPGSPTWQPVAVPAGAGSVVIPLP